MGYIIIDVNNDNKEAKMIENSIIFALKVAMVVGACAIFPDSAKEYSKSIGFFRVPY